MFRWSVFLVVLLSAAPLRAQVLFPPRSEPLKLIATLADERIAIDGRLDEAAWRAAAIATDFITAEPVQGRPTEFPTQVKVLFDERGLYVGAELGDAAGSSEIRAPDLRRDFSERDFDWFGVYIDSLNDLRSALTFQITPYGAQRDVSSIDQSKRNEDWNALWRSATKRHDDGWTAELFIPWKTLRYRAGTKSMGINFARRVARVSEVSAWSPYPRYFSAYRMNYAGRVEGLEVPDPKLNLQLAPFGIGRVIGESSDTELDGDLGLDVKWAPTPNSIVDVTINTDFAEADVDRAVVNLNRIDFFFPERRTFFLEGASTFNTGRGGRLVPFFSRRIGLDDDANVLPITGGLRFLQRNSQRSVGALAIHTRDPNSGTNSAFGVARYSENLGEESRVGGLLVARSDGADDALGGDTNVVAALDGFARTGGWIGEAMASVSTSSGDGGEGFGGTFEGGRNTDYGYVGLSGGLVTERYEARVGFVGRENTLFLRPQYFGDIRPEWMPSWLRRIDPDLFADIFLELTTGDLQEARMRIQPLAVEWVTGHQLEVQILPEWQELDEEFEPIDGLVIDAGSYQFNRFRLIAESDPSRWYSAALFATTGGYYNGTLHQVESRVGLSPVPYVTFYGTLLWNGFRGVGPVEEDRDEILIAPELRLALSPRLQATGILQRNTADDFTGINARIIWEYLPRSFFFLVYDRTEEAGVVEYRFTAKLTLTWQI